MKIRYEPVEEPRFVVEQTPTGERIVIRARRQLFVMLVLAAWLVAWTVGGANAILVFSAHFQLFLLAWLCGWAIGWIFVAATLAWMLCGTETIRAVGSDLEIVHAAAGLSRRRVYEGSRISGLSTLSPPAWPSRFQWQTPFFGNSRYGAIKFNYGPRTVYAASDLDEGEAQLIIDRLVKRLPRAATPR